MFSSLTLLKVSLNLPYRLIDRLFWRLKTLLQEIRDLSWQQSQWVLTKRPEFHYFVN